MTSCCRYSKDLDVCTNSTTLFLILIIILIITPRYAEACFAHKLSTVSRLKKYYDKNGVEALMSGEYERSLHVYIGLVKNEYTNLCILHFMLFIFIYSSPFISFSISSSDPICTSTFQNSTLMIWMPKKSK